MRKCDDLSPLGALVPKRTLPDLYVRVSVSPCLRSSVDIFVVCRSISFLSVHPWTFLSMDKDNVVTFESFKAMKP